ncbi:hypothetical protein [Marininema halotolerans]|uniref:Uncharacterized protein n=1 Tax=Marininema halotolerans TaxID=1155944 RepID=A0A1I6ULU5_9BACL|nr:hypothetical protein [Marininema halotolerans]SFT02410.1 hypothetical protein SAMN05444972_11813 [Marininema halotolerans]
MDKLFLKWIQNYAEDYFGPGIEVEIDYTKHKIDNPSSKITNIKSNIKGIELIGDAIVWENGCMDIHIINDNQDTVLWEHHLVDENVSFDHILSNYREVFQKGQLNTVDTLRTFKIQASCWNGDWDGFIARQEKDPRNYSINKECEKESINNE